MKRYGLIGFPLGHSFSARYFADKFEREGISDCRYDLFPIESIDMLPALLKENPDLQGLNITIPYKQVVLSFLNDRNNIPEGVTACNCIKISDGLLTGYNTDVPGFILSIQGLLKPYHDQALILGNGGATEAVRYGLRRLGISFKVVGRRHVPGVDLLYHEISPEMLIQYKLLINTTPLGTYPHVEAAPELPYDAIGDAHMLYDLVYNPAVTKFMNEGLSRGATVKNGYDMLVIQAEQSWDIWRGLWNGGSSQP